MGRSNSLKFIPGEPSLCRRLNREKSPEDEALIAASLRGNPNLRQFAPFSEEQISTLVSIAWKEEIYTGEVLMNQGDLNNETFYIIGSGSFEVSSETIFDVVTTQGYSYLSRPNPGKEQSLMRSPGSTDNLLASPSMGSPTMSKMSLDGNVTVHTVSRGCSFGDSSMFYGTPRWATIAALERSFLWVLSQSSFKTMQMQIDDDKKHTQKSKADDQLIAVGLEKNDNLQRLTKLTSEHIKKLVGMAWVQPVEEGTVLMNEGDLNADAFYIIGGGTWQFIGHEPFEVIEKGPEVSHLHRAAHTGRQLSQDAEDVTVKTVTRGLCFGEISMLYCAPRFATVTAKTDGYLLTINRACFQAVQMQAAEDEIHDRVVHLQELDVFHPFSERDKQKFAGVMEKMRFHKGDYIMQRGEKSTTMYILEEGKVECSVEGSQVKTLEADPNEGTVHFFGSEALVGDKPGGEEAVKVVSEDALALVLEQTQFEKICDRLVEAAPAPAFTRYSTTVSKQGPKNDGMSMGNLVNGGLLGVSALGPVELCRHKHTKEVYALKRMGKGLLVQKGLRKSVMREKKLYEEIISPFIVRAFATFNEPQNLCLLLEAALGGELSAVYQRQAFWGSVKHTKFYAAGIILALEHLHNRRIIYRNLKPKNVMLSHLGQPKLTDMGLSKLVVSNTFTVCGTPTYMAPEVVAGIGHNRSADWWSLGVLLFELMSKRTPFESEHPMQIYSKIMRGITRVKMPSECQGEVGHLIRSLLKNRSVDRLPMLKGGVDNILGHEWFAGFQWDEMRSQHLEPPYQPSFEVAPRTWKDLKDDNLGIYLTHFAPDKAKLPRNIEYRAEGFEDDEWDEDFA